MWYFYTRHNEEEEGDVNYVYEVDEKEDDEVDEYGALSEAGSASSYASEYVFFKGFIV